MLLKCVVLKSYYYFYIDKPRILDLSKDKYVDDDGRKMSLYIKLTVSAFPKPHTCNLTTAIKGIKSLLWNNFSVNPIEVKI